MHSVDYQISLEYLVLKMFELTSTIHVTCMILIFLFNSKHKSNYVLNKYFGVINW